MLRIALLFVCGLAVAQPVPLTPVVVGCRAIVVKPNPNIGTVPTVVKHYEMERCADVQFKGGGVVIRYITEPAMRKFATVYFPAHTVSEVVVMEEQPQ